MIKKYIVAFLAIYATLLAAPQAIVFDFGGVLTGEPNKEAIIHFIQKSFDLSREEFEKINQEKRIAVRLGKTDEEFWLSYAKTRGHSLPFDWNLRFQSVMKEAIGVNLDMYVLVEELRENQIPVALLSNIDERLAKLIRDFGFYKPFSPCLLSCEIGIEKPDPGAYEIVLERLNLQAEDIVLIDDRLENIDAAQRMGFDAILFESETQLRIDLSKRGLLQL